MGASGQMRLSNVLNFRVARQNEAAGAADAAAWVRSAVVIFYSQINYGSQGGHPYDPSTKNHAGGTPATSLLAGYHTTLHPLGRKIRTTLPLLSGPPGSAAHSGVPGTTLHGAEAVARWRDQPSVRPALLLRPDTQEA